LRLPPSLFNLSVTLPPDISTLGVIELFNLGVSPVKFSINLLSPLFGCKSDIRFLSLFSPVFLFGFLNNLNLILGILF